MFCTVLSASAQTDTSDNSKADSAFYVKPDVEASYPGGVKYWTRYLQRNLLYPEPAPAKRVQGTVVTQFVVDTNGAVQNLIILSGPKELREETIRVIEHVDIWVPGMYKGQKVNSLLTLPISFKNESW